MNTRVNYPSGEFKEFDAQNRLAKDGSRSRWGVGAATAIGVGSLSVPGSAIFCAGAMGAIFGGVFGAAPVALAMIAVGAAIGAVGGGFIARDAARENMDAALGNPAAPQTFREKLDDYRHRLSHLDAYELPAWERKSPATPSQKI